MNLRHWISIALGSIGLLAAQAQTHPEDSLRQRKITKKEAEIYINPEAVKNIQFDFMGTPEPTPMKPMMSQDKPWMKFRQDLPMSLTDTTLIQKSDRIRVSPYTPAPMLTKYDFSIPDDSLIIHMSLDFDRVDAPYRGSGGVGVSIGFDANKLLYENFTKRGRFIKRNRKRAKAWRIYEDYVPTKEDHQHLRKK